MQAGLRRAVLLVSAGRPGAAVSALRVDSDQLGLRGVPGPGGPPAGWQACSQAVAGSETVNGSLQGA